MALGLTLQTLTPALAESLGMPPGAEGGAITDVAEAVQERVPGRKRGT
jgi:hypothetical protein